MIMSKKTKGKGSGGIIIVILIIIIIVVLFLLFGKGFGFGNGTGFGTGNSSESSQSTQAQAEETSAAARESGNRTVEKITVEEGSYIYNNSTMELEDIVSQLTAKEDEFTVEIVNKEGSKDAVDALASVLDENGISFSVTEQAE